MMPPLCLREKSDSVEAGPQNYWGLKTHLEYVLMPSGRRHRLTNCRLNRYKFSLVPILIKVLNSKNLI